MLESSLSQLNVDVKKLKEGLMIVKNLPIEDKQRSREFYLTGMNKAQRREALAYYDIYDRFAEAEITAQNELKPDSPPTLEKQ